MDNITLWITFIILKGMISITLSENCSEKHLPVGVFPYDISLRKHKKTCQNNKNVPKIAILSLILSMIFIIRKYWDIAHFGRRPELWRNISWEPSLLETNGKKQQFCTDLYFKMSLSCFLTPKNGRTPPSP